MAIKCGYCGGSIETQVPHRCKELREAVHDSHCCPRHGCKYGDEDCPVEVGTRAGVPCESCCDLDEEFKNYWSGIGPQFPNETITLNQETFKDLIRATFEAGRGY